VFQTLKGSLQTFFSSSCFW